MTPHIGGVALRRHALTIAYAGVARRRCGSDAGSGTHGPWNTTEQTGSGTARPRSGDAQSSNPPDDLDMIEPDALPLDADTDFEDRRGPARAGAARQRRPGAEHPLGAHADRATGTHAGRGRPPRRGDLRARRTERRHGALRARVRGPRRADQRDRGPPRRDEHRARARRGGRHRSGAEDGGGRRRPTSGSAATRSATTTSRSCASPPAASGTVTCRTTWPRGCRSGASPSRTTG